MSSTRPAPHPVPDYRLTRRGRVVVLLAALVVAVAAAVALATSSVASGEAASTRVVVVQPGQTMWDVAAGAAGSEDVRVMLDRIVELNDLDGVGLVVGQRLTVPDLG